jgi:hypothetical protein
VPGDPRSQALGKPISGTEPAQGLECSRLRISEAEFVEQPWHAFFRVVPMAFSTNATYSLMLL